MKKNIGPFLRNPNFVFYCDASYFIKTQSLIKFNKKHDFQGTITLYLLELEHFFVELRYIESALTDTNITLI